MNKSGFICVMAFVSPNEQTRKRAAEVVGEENFIVVHLDAPTEMCAERNLSDKREGAKEESLSHYQPPATADLVLDTGKLSPAECVAAVLSLLESRNVIS